MIDIDLTDIAHGGACVGRAPDGRVVFARFGLPGERVRVEVTGERSSLVRGDVVEVLSRLTGERPGDPGRATEAVTTSATLSGEQT